MRLTRRGRRATIAGRTTALVLAAGLALAACAAGTRSPSFPAGTTMDRLHRDGAITIGVKVDQPGFGFRNLVTDQLEGFDIEIAKLIAAGLGLTPGQIHFREAISSKREELLQKGDVDIIVATYSITSKREEQVGQAGPYYTTGQRLLVRAEDKTHITGPRDLAGRKVCSARGSTSVQNITDMKIPGLQIRAADYYTQCVQELLAKTVDAVTTDGTILAVYAAQQPDNLAVVGEPFSTEEYGIGYPRGDYAFCQYITNVLRQAINDGAWDRAFNDTLGKAGVPRPDERPQPRSCQPEPSTGPSTPTGGPG